MSSVRSLSAIILLSMFSASLVSPALAHFTLGDLTPVPRFHLNDFTPHVGGPTGYVWPGSGLSSFTGGKSGFPPGYQSPFPGGNPPGQPKDVYQLEGDAYSPFGAILTSTNDYNERGPLIFALDFSQPCQFGWNDVDNTCGSGAKYAENFTGLSIYIPPEFDLSALFSGRYGYNPGLIESTFGATADDIILTQASAMDPWGPGWWVVSIMGDIHWWPQHDYREWYYVRINDVVAPKVAGRYFFKVFLQDQFFNFVYPGMPRSSLVTGGECGSCNQGTVIHPSLGAVPYSGPTNATIPVENWPVLLVKGEIDPAIMTGTIRFGTFNNTLYGRPISLSGRVRAIGTAINPYRRDHPTTGRTVEGIGYFNATAQGHYEVEGLASGIYDVYASAAGYPEQLVASKVTVLPTQSLHLDGYINPGIVVKGTVYSRDRYGPSPWPAAPRPIYIEIYRNDDYSVNSLASFSPLNLTHQPYMAYDWDYFSNHPNLPTPRPVAFPWFSSSFSYYSTALPAPSANPNHNSHPPIVCGGKIDACGKPNGIGSAQYWWVDSLGAFTNRAGADGFAFQFGVEGIFGAPTDFDGHVPQSFASWVGGLGAGRYWMRAWVNGYTQTLSDGNTPEQVSFAVSDHDWAGDIYVLITLRVSGTLIVTAHFRDQKESAVDCPIDGCTGNLATGLSRGNRFLVAELRDKAGTLMGINFTEVFSNQTSAKIEINGFGLIGPDTAGIKYSYLTYQGYRDYGIPTGSYRLYFYMRGYLQSETDLVSFSSGSLLRTSSSLHRGARLNMTLCSVDWEHPNIQRPWEFPGARLRIYVLNSETQLSAGYVGYTFLSTAAGGDRDDEPDMQPACFTRSATPPFCPTGSTQVINPIDPLGSTVMIDEWDGYPAADVDGVGIFPTVISFGLSYFPPWDLGGFLEAPSEYRLGASSSFAPNDALTTGVYSTYAFTYGYVQTSEYSLFLMEGGVSDFRMNLLKGSNVTIYIPMTLEGLIAPTQFNMSMRVRLFDSEGHLLATAATKGPDSAMLRNDFASKDFFGLGRFTGSNLHPAASVYETYYADPFSASPSPGNNPQRTGSLESVDESHSADTFLWYGSWPIGEGGKYVTGWQAFDSDPDHDGVSDFGSFQFNANFWGLSEWRTVIPYDTRMVRVSLAGIYDTFGDPLDGQNSGGLSTPPWKNGAGEKMDSLQYGIYGTDSNRIDRSLTVEVDCWNEYPKPTFLNGKAPPVTNWYPPVEGLLEGDSFHTILDKTPSFGFTEGALSPNGLGPYMQEHTWTLPNVIFGGETSGIFRLDKRGHIEGSVLGFTIDNQPRPVSWARIDAETEGYNLTQYSWDGHYDMYLDPGRYNISIGLWDQNATVGYKLAKIRVSISPGQASTGFNFQLQLGYIPINEYSNPTLQFATSITTIVSVFLIRDRNRRIKAK